MSQARDSSSFSWRSFLPEKPRQLHLPAGFYLICCLLAGNPVLAQEIPQIHGLKKAGSRNDRQCWSVTEDCDGHIYVATASGVQIFNGFQWQLVPLPLNRIPRTVYLGKDCIVYAGGFETFGSIDYQPGREPVYVPIGDTRMNGTNEEIWNIVSITDKLIVQSFAYVYVYDYDTLHLLPSRSGVMLGRVIDDIFYIPEIGGDIMRLVGDTLQVAHVIPGQNGDIKVAGLCGTGTSGEMIIATEKHGLFLATPHSVEAIHSPDIDLIALQQMNALIRLENGPYAIGTILNGLYITQDLSHIDYHINKNNGLSDNTVLAISEDRNGDLWVGMDSGLDVVRISSPVRFYYDATGILGTIYASQRYHDDLFLATNHGIFQRKPGGDFRLLPNSQGQSWTFCVFDDQLLCGHNNGTFCYRDGELEVASEVTGGWWMHPLNDSTILESTYTGLILMHRDGERWTSERVRHGNILMRKFVLGGHTLLGYHQRYGLCLLQLSDDYSEVLSVAEISEIDGRPVMQSIGMFLCDDRIIVEAENRTYEAADGHLRALAPDEVAALSANARFHRAHESYRTLMDSDEEFTVSNLDHMALAEMSYCYFSRDEGYEVARIQSPPDELSVSVDYVYINGVRHPLQALEDLRPSERNISVQLRNLEEQPNARKLWYRLEQNDRIWQPVPTSGELIFRNLANGDYALQVRDVYNNQLTVAGFTIPPYWYVSWQGGLLYAVIILLAFRLWHKYVEHRMAEEALRLLMIKEREVEAERIKSNNERLERELRLKSKLLANRAMALVQKNKLLGQLKELAQSNKPSNRTDEQVRSRIIHMVDQHTDHEDEWEVFQNNFDEVHEKFTERLIIAHPDLTSGEKRLAAFIRMDLSSKEIAPLLGISVRSVENKRHRLRKKMNLEFGESLSEYLMRL